MEYLDHLTRAIKHKFAKDFATTLREAETEDVYGGVNCVTIPVRADVRIAYDKDLAAFSIRGGIYPTNKNEWLGGSVFLSTHDINNASDKAMLIEHVFEDAKQRMLYALANGELDKILGKEQIQ